MKIRAVKTEEIPALTELAVRSKAYWGYSQEFMDACHDELGLRPAEHRHYFCAEKDRALAGYYGLERLDEDRVELDALFVDPPMIGRGVGRALLQHAQAKASEFGASRMIIQGDPHAERFYHAAGATRIGERPSGSIRGRSLPLFEIKLKA